MNENIYNPNGSSGDIINQEYIPNTTLATSDINYLYPRQVGTGSTRGTQTIGVGNINIDGSNDQIDITSTTGGSSIVLGQQSSSVNQSGVATSSIPGSSGTFGLSITGSNGASLVFGVNQGGNVEGTFNDGVTNRLLIGQNKAGKEVVWISKSGVDVTSAAESQLTFNSDKSFTVLLQSSYTFSSLGSIPDSTFATSAVIPIPHNSGFVPNVNFFSQQYLNNNPYSPALPTLPTGYPLSKLTSVGMGTSVLQLSNSTGEAFFTLWLSFDETNLYLGLGFTNFTGTTVVASAITIYYTVYTLSATTS